jgi:hypothetical protein
MKSIKHSKLYTFMDREMKENKSRLRATWIIGGGASIYPLEASLRKASESFPP